MEDLTGEKCYAWGDFWLLQVLEVAPALLPMLSLYLGTALSSLLGFAVIFNAKAHKRGHLLGSEKEVSRLLRETEFTQHFPCTWLTSAAAQKWMKESTTAALCSSFAMYWNLFNPVGLFENSWQVRCLEWGGGWSKAVWALLGRRPAPAHSALSKQNHFGMHKGGSELRRSLA